MSEETVTVDAHDVRVTNPGKVIYPAAGTTKQEVIDYYLAIADVMLPHCRDRAATRKRWPNGVGDDGKAESFFQKDLGAGAPDWVATGEIQHKDHVNTYPLVNEAATLVWFAQLSALEVHVPQWRFSAEREPLPPDRLVFDLDPGEGVDLAACAGVAVLVRDALEADGYATFPVTSGSKGIHLYAHLGGAMSSDEASAYAKEVAKKLEAEHADAVTSSIKKDDRPGKVFFDYSQNTFFKTTVAPYSLRGRAQPSVAAPRTWDELLSPDVSQLTYPEVLTLVADRGDPMSALG